MKTKESKPVQELIQQFGINVPIYMYKLESVPIRGIMHIVKSERHNNNSHECRLFYKPISLVFNESEEI